MIVPYLNFKKQWYEEREEIESAIREVFNRGDFIMGKEVLEFEHRFKDYVGTKHAISVANGTDSLILSLLALGVGSGDEVVTTSNSWISSASSVRIVGARPVFCDVAADQNLDIGILEKKITRKTKAIMAVHLTGKMARMPEILYIAGKFGIPVLEDAAQAIGAKIHDRRAGAWGKLGSFSLHPLKNLNAAGDAGIITTDDDYLAEHLRKLRNHGMKSRDEIDFWGYNSRLDTIQAAILLPRLAKIDKVIAQRRYLAKLYTQALSQIVTCPQPREDEFHTYHVYVIMCERRSELQKFLLDRGVETKIHYPIPIHLQRCAQDLGYFSGDLPKTEHQAERILSLPINQYLDSEHVSYVCSLIKEFYS